MLILEQNAINFLNKELRLPTTGFEQDWDIELANANRIIEFIEFYDNTLLSNDKKIALMALIVGSLEDLANIEPVDQSLWKQIEELLCDNYHLFKSIIDYWSLSNEKNYNDIFAITTLMRNIHCPSASTSSDME